MVSVSSMWGLWGPTPTSKEETRPALPDVVLPRMLLEDDRKGRTRTSTLYWMWNQKTCFGEKSQNSVGPARNEDGTTKEGRRKLDGFFACPNVLG